MIASMDSPITTENQLQAVITRLEASTGYLISVVNHLLAELHQSHAISKRQRERPVSISSSSSIYSDPPKTPNLGSAPVSQAPDYLIRISTDLRPCST
jgi:hypothetical protein